MSAAGPVAFNTIVSDPANGRVQINNVAGNLYMLSEDKADKIYKWLNAPDSSGNFLAAREKHHEQTGAWFIEGEEYRGWKEISDSALWVYGTPGCGKTIICSTVVEDTLLRCSGNPTHACAYFFFDNRNAQTDQALHHKFIRSIIEQLCDQLDDVPAPLVEIYGNGRQQVSVASLERTLQKILEGFERTYIIIDAVDECTDRMKVLAWLDKLTRCKTGNIRVLFSSRPEWDIEDRLRSIISLARVNLNNSLTEKDIEMYIDAMLSILASRWDAQTIARVRDALIERSDGMFRWVALQISELFNCATRKAVYNQLQDLPRDLEGMYERSLLKSPRREDLKRFLMCLAFSLRPLEPKELADVVAVGFSSNSLPSYDADLRYFGLGDMFMTCSTFVSETEGTPLRFIKLAHMSVKDYLVSDRLKNGPASFFSINAMLTHSMITKISLAYLFHLRTCSSIIDSVSESFPLGRYAADYWIKHMHLGGGEDEHFSQMMDCIFSSDSGLANWVRLHNADNIDKHGFECPTSTAPLYYACFNGLQRISHRLLIDGAAVNAQGGVYGNALQAASYNGHDATVRLLLEHGADARALGGHFGSALQAASYWGRHATVRLLLENGADADAKAGTTRNDNEKALLAASRNGHDDIIRMLLKDGADVSARGGYHGSVLETAAYYGRHTTVQLLLEEGADMNVQGKYGNALRAASDRGHEAIVRLLLEEGADVNAKGGEYGNALQAASKGHLYGPRRLATPEEGYVATIRLLIAEGADVNAQGGEYGNALQGASYGGHLAIVQLLFERGAHVNAQGGKFGNALQAASGGCYSRGIAPLLEHGADLNVQGGMDGCALPAPRKGHLDTVLLLIAEGADVNAQGGEYGNALQAASQGGHHDIVQLLLERGAHVNAQGGEFGNALQAASQTGFSPIVQLLLKHGADVNAQGGKYGNALQAAVSIQCHYATVQLLLERGADVNAQGGEYGSALQAASKQCHYATVRLLLEKGADVNAKGGQHGGVLKAARFDSFNYSWEAPKEKGRESTVKLLLEHGAIDEGEESSPERKEDEQDEEQDDGTDSTGIEVDGGSAGSSSEDEWASAQEDGTDGIEIEADDSSTGSVSEE